MCLEQQKEALIRGQKHARKLLRIMNKNKEKEFKEWQESYFKQMQEIAKTLKELR
ncbi:hypothetical protein DCO58_11880 [Helicobacter saguini]|uniref:Uncharacterized protein n=1 Tax=Helicobacter saguini TaxID=1548018 RepID=A0A6B0HTU5_9HELI|nr:hypothetical protein [Helicobacter saguini]MWV61012.1 hypothetical protein [Helicobacter saguini]MWV68319.1 hypothetical protein [Helicobacter saguini]MWV70216.1 hypothetical protein [Helicobacter saguini]MWV72119.1 hypothetical protein [Helicobacter saguini]